MRIETRGDETFIEMDDRESGSAAQEAVEESSSRGEVRVTVRYGLHEATDTERSEAPRGRMFPRPVRPMGAVTPECLVLDLSTIAEGVGGRCSRSDVLRILGAEFVRALHSKGPGDGWANRIVQRLEEVVRLRESGVPMSYATLRRRRS